MTIHHHNPTDFESTVFFDFQAEGFDVHGPITTRINDIVDMEGIDIAPPRAILYLNRQSQHHSPMYHFLDSHNYSSRNPFIAANLNGSYSSCVNNISLSPLISPPSVGGQLAIV